MAEREQVLAAWLREFERSGWRRAHIDNVAAIAELPRARIIAAIGDRYAAVAAFADTVADGAVAAAIDGDSVRERLFDGIMQGFDALQEQRDAVLPLWQARDPQLLALLAGRLALGVRRLALAAGMAPAGPGGQLRRLALLGILWRSFAVWRADASADLSATMAALDQALGKAERVATQGLSADLIGLPGLTLWRRGAADAGSH